MLFQKGDSVKINGFVLIIIFMLVDMAFYVSAPREITRENELYKFPFGGGIAAYLTGKRSDCR